MSFPIKPSAADASDAEVLPMNKPVNKPESSDDVPLGQFKHIPTQSPVKHISFENSINKIYQHIRNFLAKLPRFD